jgi:D-glycero-D-manno-heptose 1,7-bisphosphate phosphatase
LTIDDLWARGVEAVFLDRDGTINVKAPEGGYVSQPSQVVLIPGAATAVALLNQAKVCTVLVTNQRWMSTPSADLTAYAATQRRLMELLEAEGAHLDAAYHCPHAYRSCYCRKPAPGMLQQAATDLELNFSSSVIIGDSVSDMGAGRAVGARTILCGPSQTQPNLADAVQPDLLSAVKLLLRGEGNDDVRTTSLSKRDRLLC